MLHLQQASEPISVCEVYMPSELEQVSQGLLAEILRQWRGKEGFCRVERDDVLTYLTLLSLLVYLSVNAKPVH